MCVMWIVLAVKLNLNLKKMKAVAVLFLLMVCGGRALQFFPRDYGGGHIHKRVVPPPPSPTMATKYPSTCAALQLDILSRQLKESGVSQPFLCKGLLLRAIRGDVANTLDDIDVCVMWTPSYNPARLKMVMARVYTAVYKSTTRFTSGWALLPPRCQPHVVVDILVLYPALPGDRANTSFLAAGPGSTTANRRYGAYRFWWTNQRLVPFTAWPQSWGVPDSAMFYTPVNASLHLEEAFGTDWHTPIQFSYDEGISRGKYTNLYTDKPPPLPRKERPWPMEVWDTATLG